MNTFIRLLMRGLVVGLPLFITIAILIWLLAEIESWFSAVLVYLLGNAYIPGMGLVFGLGVAVGLGVVASTWLGRRCLSWVNAAVDRVPVVKTIYGAIKDIFSLFDRGTNKALEKAVMVEWGGRRFLGFITRDSNEGLPAGLMGDDDVVVYLPMGYQIGGFPVVVPRDQVTSIDMSVDAALKFALTAGATTTTATTTPAEPPVLMKDP